MSRYPYNVRGGTNFSVATVASDTVFSCFGADGAEAVGKRASLEFGSASSMPCSTCLDSTAYSTSLATCTSTWAARHVPYPDQRVCTQ